MTIGERLKIFAKNKYGSITNLARVMELSQPQISQYISGVTEPSAKNLSKLAELGCDINWLLTGKPYINEEDERRKLKQIEELKNEINKYKAKVLDLLEAKDKQILKAAEPLNEYKPLIEKKISKKR